MTQPIDIKSVGIDFRHDLNFTVDRPHGTGEDIFLYFLTPVIFRVQGCDLQLDPYHLIFTTADYPLFYHGNGVGLGNHWFHFIGFSQRSFLKKYQIPTDTIMPSWPDTTIVPLMRRIHLELHRQAEFAPQAITLLFEQLCLEIARFLHRRHQTPLTRHKTELLEEFRDFRARLKQHFAYDWSVPEMADKLHLSPSRFAVLYKEFFDTTPMDDLIQARLEHAQWLLAGTTCAIEHVAQQSGFHNVQYFSRFFHRKLGLTPTAFAQRHRR